MFTAETFRAQAGRANRYVVSIRNQPSWLLKLVGLVWLVVFAGVVLLLVIPATIIALLVFIAGMGVAAVKRAFRRSKEPNGALDGRRNVRVRLPQDQGA